MFSKTATLRCLASVFFCTVTAPGQGEGDSPPPTSSALLLRLSASSTTLSAARTVAQDLADRPVIVRTQLFDLLARRYQQTLRAFAKNRERLQRQLDKVVPQVQRELIHRARDVDVAEMQKRALEVSRRPDLTKTHIRDQIDPLLAQLRAIVLPTPEQVLTTDDGVARTVAELRSELDEVHGWFDLYLDTMRGLDGEAIGQRHVDKHKQEPDPPDRDAIDADLELYCLFALPLNGRDQRVLAQNDALRGTMIAEEYAGTLELNRIRIALGLSTLLIDEKLGNAARDHSSDMRTLGFFSHTSPVDGKTSPGDRAARAGTSGGAENIASGQSTGRSAIKAWWYSPGHHKNMLGGHARTGLGQCEQLWTQMFGG